MSQINESNRAKATIREPLAHASASPPRRRETRAGRLRRVAMWALIALGAAWALTYPISRSLPNQELGADDEGLLVNWQTLAGLDDRTGEAEPGLAALDGKLVKVAGYIVPLEEDGSEFLLVPYVGACVHYPPPPANQMIYVRMPPDAELGVDLWGWDPIYTIGTLEIARYDSPYGAAGFRMTALRNEPYPWSEG